MDSAPILVSLASLGLLAGALGACAPAAPVSARFEQTGELVALSGGAAGARGACITCHGLEGEGDGNLTPRLAGLDPGYIARQMDNYARGQRHHPQMAWIARRLDWSARQKVAAYYAEMETPRVARPDRAADACAPVGAQLYHSGDPARGIAACVACHGDDGLGVGKGNPPLAGQPAPYLAKQLDRWRSGERYGDPLGTMGHVSRLLGAHEIAPLARYASGPPDSRRYPALREECLPERRSSPRNDA